MAADAARDSALLRDYRRLKERHERAIDQLASLLAENESLKERSAGDSRTTDEVRVLRRALENAKQDASKAVEQRDAARQEVYQLRDQLGRHGGPVAGGTDAMRSPASSRAADRAQHEVLETLSRRLKDEREARAQDRAAADDEIAKLRKEVARLQDQLTRIESEADELNNAQHRLEEDNRDLAEDVRDLEGTLAKTQTARSRLKGDMSELQDELDSVRRERDTLHDALIEARENVRRQDEEVSTLQRSLDDIQQRLRDAMQAGGTAFGDYAKLKEQNISLNDEIIRLRRLHDLALRHKRGDPDAARKLRAANSGPTAAAAAGAGRRGAPPATSRPGRLGGAGQLVISGNPRALPLSARERDMPAHERLYAANRSKQAEARAARERRERDKANAGRVGEARAITFARAREAQLRGLSEHERRRVLGEELGRIYIDISQPRADGDSPGNRSRSTHASRR